MRQRKLGWLIAVAFAVLPLMGGAGPMRAVESFSGKVMPLDELVAASGGKLDADAKATSLALVSDDGKVYLLVKDAGSRLFFKDKALLNRPMRLTGRLLPGSQVLRVVSVRSMVRGEECEVFYWCNVCSIQRGERNICDCCGGPLELREEPVKK